MGNVDFDLAKRKLPNNRSELNRLCLRWYDAVIYDPELRGAGILKTAWIIQSHINVDRGYGWSSFDLMAKNAGMNTKTFERSVAQLESRDWILVNRKRGCSNQYVINPFKAARVRTTDMDVRGFEENEVIEPTAKTSEPQTPVSVVGERTTEVHVPGGVEEQATTDTDVRRPQTSMSDDHRHGCLSNLSSNYSRNLSNGARERTIAVGGARTAAPEKPNSHIIRRDDPEFPLWINHFELLGHDKSKIEEVLEAGAVRVLTRMPPQVEQRAAS